ncbi:PREDICTED: uncharacterized protein LOC102020261 [Chinchilla lanigera]|uniref:uncharacterized protein LOC102020261 n=1 Tax=Chinchilla lanigera TaxID=34839 RepID=UPI00038EA62C|nr:PREDICTED: uncharacterized protein LOC102020261 [Chinchilla lanigera]
MEPLSPFGPDALHWFGQDVSFGHSSRVRPLVASGRVKRYLCLCLCYPFTKPVSCSGGESDPNLMEITEVQKSDKEYHRTFLPFYRFFPVNSLIKDYGFFQRGLFHRTISFWVCYKKNDACKNQRVTPVQTAAQLQNPEHKSPLSSLWHGSLPKPQPWEFQEDAVVKYKETASLRFGDQTLEYSNVKKRRREMGPWDPEGSEVRIEAHRESKEEDLNAEEGGGKEHFSPEP